MASDGCAQGKPKFEGFSLSVNARNEAEADRVFAALAEGGEVRMPLGKTFFAKRFRPFRRRLDDHRGGLSAARRARIDGVAKGGSMVLKILIALVAIVAAFAAFVAPEGADPLS